jgi:peptidoglycan/xylan/chitin deacetylase (PgdA/CDA1 family)
MPSAYATKRWLKRAAAAVVDRAGLYDRRERVVALCYHSIHPTKSLASATPELFQEHLSWLQEECDVIPFTDIPRALSRAKPTRPAVAITFDDGYCDNYDYAFPILESHGLTATFFVTVGLVEQEESVIEIFKRLRTSSRDDVLGLNWDQIREMRAAGNRFGAHTYRHANLARVAREEAELELEKSKELLESRLGEAVETMAYPFGKRGRHFTDTTVEFVKNAGYESAASVLFRAVRPTDSRFAIPRFFVTKDDGPTLKQKVEGAWDPVGLWQEHAPAWAARLVSPADFRG